MTVKYFILKAEVGFFAEDIDDALMSLALHFKHLAQGKPTNLFAGGEIKLHPYEAQSQEPTLETHRREAPQTPRIDHEDQQQTDEASGQEPAARGQP